MAKNQIDVLIIGGGQAGIAMSEHLTVAGIDHVVLEKARIAERWRTGRWDSLVTNGPAWHDRFPAEGHDGDPDHFPAKDEIADYLERYAAGFNAPIHTGVEVTEVVPVDGGGFTVTTSEGDWYARRVIVATGPFQQPAYPDLIAATPELDVIHSSQYASPEALREGGVLVIGAGSSGAQIADELLRAGRRVVLAVGPHERPPRRYRDRDLCWWMGALGMWDQTTLALPEPPLAIAMSGALGGTSVDFREYAQRGMTLVGRVTGYADGVVEFADDLAANLREGDRRCADFLAAADAYIARNNLDLPEDPQAHEVLPDPECVTTPLREMDLAAEGITTVMWATGFSADYSWIKADIFDERGRPVHTRGVTAQPGLMFLGLPWQTRRGSGFIWGVWYDARELTDRIAVEKRFAAYRSPRER